MFGPENGRKSGKGAPWDRSPGCTGRRIQAKMADKPPGLSVQVRRCESVARGTTGYRCSEICVVSCGLVRTGEYSGLAR